MGITTVFQMKTINKIDIGTDIHWNRVLEWNKIKQKQNKSYCVRKFNATLIPRGVLIE